ncbi:MAG: hypothetical protein KAR06_11205 [Deltaproteobacteria bacterium]|nr:hypothetical protein [Deltaproteobacteria bacterium]
MKQRLIEQTFSRADEYLIDLKGVNFFNEESNIVGLAYLARAEIAYNIHYLKTEYRAYIFDKIVPHELAHLLAHQRFKTIGSHGKVFQMCFRITTGQEVYRDPK